MLKLTDKQIKEITDNLDMGMNCYFNTKTEKLLITIDFENRLEIDEELWEKDRLELENNNKDYFEFEKMPSNKSFKIMVDFAEKIENETLRNLLINALNKPKPFKNFRMILDNSVENIQEWYKFKDENLVNWVKEQIDYFNSKNENNNYQ